MPRIVCIAASLLIATATFAGGLAVSPRAVTLRAGERVVLHAANVPGGLSGGFPYSAKFTSDKPSVARVTGFASGSGYLKPDPIPFNGDVYVTAVAPGVAHVVTVECCGEMATITVLPRPVLRIDPSAATVLAGQTAVFVAFISDAPPDVVYYWYEGRAGDMTKLLQGSLDPTLRITPDPRLTNIWVRAVALGWIDSAEAQITVVAGRRRATRR